MNIRRLGSVVGLVVTFAFASITAAAQGRPSLITPPRGGDLQSGQDIGGAVTRARTVTPDARVISRALDALQLRPTRPVELEVPFFDDVTLVVHLNRVERAGKGVTNFYGTVEGDPLGSVVITNSRGTLVMNVLFRGKSYQVLSAGGRYIAKEVDRSKLQDAEGDDTLTPPARAKSSADVPPMVADGAGTIDVMVIYTSAARAATGSVAAIEAEIDLAIASTNQAYAASGITQRLNLVHTQEIAYASDTASMNQAAFSTALNAITNGTAPFTAVPGLRNTHGADLVSLWVQGAGNGTTICGLGWLLQTNSSAGDEYGYSVVLREPCAISNGSFAHELGHNMGLQHDTYVSPIGPSYPTFVPYAHGYVRITAPRFRTLMAYNDHCVATGGSCTRINQFSSPIQNYSGVPTGTVATEDAARALNESALAVANFRQAVPDAGSIDMRFANQSVSEGVGTAQVAVARLAGSLGAVSVSYATGNGTAIAGTHYTSATGVLNWANGDFADKFVSVPILQDAVGNSARTFTVTISSPGGGATLGGTTVTTVSINDDEPDVFPPGCVAPEGFTTPVGATTGFSVATDSTGEGACSFKTNPISAPGGACGPYNRAQTEFTGPFLAGNINFKARVSSEGFWDCLRFSIDGTNQNIGSCGGPGGFGLVAPNGQTETGWQTFAVPVTAGTHTVRWSFDVDCGEFGENAAWIDGVSMPLDLGPPTINLAAATTAVNENAGTATITVNRGGTTTDAIGVTWSAANGSATAGQDFGTDGNATPPGGLLSWGAGESGPKNIVIPILQNTSVESAETFTVTLSSPTGGASLGATTTNTVTITDDDSIFDLAVATLSRAENAPNTTLTINRTGSLATTATVTYTTSNGTAIAGTDFGTAGNVTPPSEVITFGPGVGSRTIAIGPTTVAAPYLRLINDTTVEGSKSFTLALGSPTGGGQLGTTTSTTITIHSEDGNYVMASATASVAESTPNVQLQVNRTATAGALTVPYTFTNGTATNGTHFTGTPGSLNWDEGDNTPRFITVPIINDGLVGSNRAFTVTLGTPTVGTTTRGATYITTVTIVEDDNTLQLTAPTFSGTEGNTVNVTVSRLGGTANAASVAFTTINGTAIAGTDYTANSGTLNWGAGDAASKTIPVVLLGDSVATGNRTLQVQLQAPVTGAALGATTLATVTRVDNDPGIKFQQDAYTVAENTASVVINVMRVGPTTAAASATWATTNGTATIGEDFGTAGSSTQRSGTVSWVAGDAAMKAITIPIINDATGSEGSETFNVVLTPGAGTVLGGAGTVVVTITDDDIPAQSEVQFQVPKITVLENVGSASLTVTRTNLGGGFGLQSTVNYSMTPGTALATSDYMASSGMLTWLPGDSTPKTITVPIVNTVVAAEPPEAFKVTLSAPSSGTGLGANSQVTVVILDDDEVFPPLGAMPASLTTPVDTVAGWHVSNDPGAYEGVFSLKTDPIGHGQTAGLQMAGTFGAGAVNFRVKISSEAGFDVLQFFVNGVLRQTWSGTAVPGWQMATSVTLDPGFNTLRWVYTKDGSASVGADAAHIDSLTTPTFTP